MLRRASKTSSNMLVISKVRVKLYIKYMVSLRCKLLVKDELKKLGIKYIVIYLGVVELMEDISPEQREQLKYNLLQSGLELLDDKGSVIVEKVKNVIEEMIHSSDELPDVNFSEYISEKLGYDYNYLSNLFSEVNGVTLQHYIINHRIEKAKELMLYHDLNISEISYMLHYSSIAHFSNQFKKITGLNPSFYKKLKQKRKLNLRDL